MRTLAVLMKIPSESFKSFNDRLADACNVLQPSAARLAVVGCQPKVDLIDSEADEPALRVAVCPLAAGDDASASQTERRLAQVLASAAGRPVMTADSDPPLVTLFCWPLTEADDVDAALAGAGDDDDDDDADDADSAEQDDDGQDDDGQDDDGQDDDDLDRSEGEPAETQPNAAGTTPGAGAAPSAAPGAAVPAAPAAPAASADPAQVPAATVPGIGRVPFGFRRRGTRLILHPEEAPIVRTILAAQAQGRTVDLIEAAVAEAHGPWVRAHWAAKEVQRHIRRILDRARFYERHLGVGVPAP